MRDPLLRAVKDFLETRELSERPVLLGYSGGPDSKALLHLLLKCREFFPLDLHLAHVDHGWRQESREEAALLSEEALALQLPYHLCTLSASDFQLKNWEEQGRLKRLNFFASLYQSLGCQGLLLAHQAGDVAETVLKRLFEGAPLYALAGFGGCGEYEGMQVWRPLLNHTKEELVQWLDERHLPYFTDPSNETSQFLRGRMRVEILPLLNKTFGKNISKNLKRVASEAEGVRDFFAQLNHPICAALGIYEQAERLDLTPHLPLHPLQLQFLLRRWLAQHGLSVSRDIVQGVANALLEGGGKKVFRTRRAMFVVSKQTVSVSVVD